MKRTRSIFLLSNVGAKLAGLYKRPLFTRARGACKKADAPSQALYALSIKKHGIIALAISMIAVNPLWSFAQAASENPGQYPSVLYIASYHQGYPWTDALTEGIFKTLSGKALIYTEYLDAKRPDYKEYASTLEPVFALKYGDMPLAAILTSDNAAFDFVSKNRDTLFKDIPVVTCGINYMTPEFLATCPGATGVMEGGHPVDTARLALELFPKTKQIVCITEYLSGNWPGEQVAIMQSAIPEINFVTIRQEKDTTPEEVVARLKETLSAAPSVVLVFGITSEDYRMTLESEAVKQFVSLGSPVFGLNKRIVEYGALGGIVQNGHKQGVTAAQMVLKVLNGTPVDKIPPVYKAIDHKVFNYEGMKYFGLIGNPLLEDAVIIEAPDSRIARYRKYLLGGLVFIGLQALLIARLVKSIRDRRRSAIKLQQSEEHLRITLASIADAVITTDIRGRVDRMNKMAERLTGWLRHEARGLRLPEVLHMVDTETREPLPNPADRILSSGTAINLSEQPSLISKDGKEFQIADSGAPILDHEGQVVGVVLVIRDITEECRLQQELEQSEERLRQNEKMDSLGRLAGGIAHDFNNMLGGILGAAELLEDDLKEVGLPLRMVQIIQNSAERAAELTKKLLDFSRQTKPKKVLFDLHEIIDDALSLLERSIDKRITIHTELSAQRPLIMGNPSQMQNTILNLCINARDAMPDGGAIDISTAPLELDAAYCEASPFQLTPGSYIEVVVRDSGCGMDADTLEHVFEPFFTTKEEGKGTGLGLPSVYGTVCTHNGAIFVESQLGQGTSIHIYLPLSESSGDSAHTQTGEALKQTGRILVIDDEESFRTIAQRTLHKLNFEVLTASSGQEGCQVFEQEHEHIGLVLLDMNMPDMSGSDTFRALRKIDPDAKVIVASGSCDFETITDLKKEGLIAHISKPYHKEELASLLAEVL